MRDAIENGLHDRSESNRFFQINHQVGSRRSAENSSGLRVLVVHGRTMKNTDFLSGLRATADDGNKLKGSSSGEPKEICDYDTTFS
jgi:hypothetical protein